MITVARSAALRTWPVPLAASIACSSAFAQERRVLPVPDLPGLKTLKGDFHLHSVFSDGDVWPTVHLWEAWRDGLDAVAFTEHVEYQPHAEDVRPDLRRPYEITRGLAEKLGLIVVQGVEITKPAPGERSPLPLGAAHFNALFVTDPAALDSPELEEALRRAQAQGAFVFWNHPGFMGKLKPEWRPVIDSAHRQGLFHGMELVNGKDFYADAFPWIEEKRLTILANSDAHQPTPPPAVGGPRPITLVFARTADAQGIKEAFLARRTAAWLGDRVWGPEAQLRALWRAAVAIQPAAAGPGERALVRVQNRSAIPFRLRPQGGPSWLRLEDAVVAAEAASLIGLGLGREAPAGGHSLELEYEVTNVQTAPGHAMVVTLPVTLEVAAAGSPGGPVPQP